MGWLVVKQKCMCDVWLRERRPLIQVYSEAVYTEGLQLTTSALHSFLVRIELMTSCAVSCSWMTVIMSRGGCGCSSTKTAAIWLVRSPVQL